MILDQAQTTMRIAKLNIYDKNNDKLTDAEFKDGDIYWTVLHEEVEDDTKYKWGGIDTYPYWLTKRELIKLTLNKQEQSGEESDRFELLDL